MTAGLKDENPSVAISIFYLILFFIYFCSYVKDRVYKNNPVTYLGEFC